MKTLSVIQSIPARIKWVPALFLCLSTSLSLFAAPAGLPAADGIAQAKYIPKRMDEIAWENDRIAHRIYGPALAMKEPTGSGIDVWVKSVR